MVSSTSELMRGSIDRSTDKSTLALGTGLEKEPLGLYLKAGRADHRVLSQLLSEGRSGMSGVISDPEYVGIQEELRSEAKSRNLETILDTRAMELATPGGWTLRRSSLPWASGRPHALSDLLGAAGEAVVGSIGRFAITHGFTSVLAPSHFLTEGVYDPWFEVDQILIQRLRAYLDAYGASDVSIHHPIAIPTKLFFDEGHRDALKTALQSTKVDSLWLRVHPFGSDTGQLTLQRYIAACRQLHDLPMPLVAERAGNIGLALLAFGAVGAVEAGVSSGEKFDFSRLIRKRPDGHTFAPQQRVYIPALGIFLPRKRAEEFFSAKSARASFGCTSSTCCRRGVSDMIADPRRHFVFTRMDEIRVMSRVEQSVRAEVYLDRILRPATDRLGRARQYSSSDSFRERFETERRKLDGWRYTLSELARRSMATTHSRVPRRRVSG